MKSCYYKREFSATLNIPVVEIILTFLVVLLLVIPAALADQQPVDVAPGNPPTPTVSMTSPTQEKAPATQPPANHSVDFLMEASSLSRQGAAPQPPSAQPLPGEAPPMPLPPTIVSAEAEDVSVLVSEQCDEGAEGTSSCSRVYSDGHYAKVLSQRSDEGDEFKQQTVIEEFDKDNELLSKKTIRYRVDYGYLQDQKGKEQELFDITQQIQGKPTTRELMVYKYSLDTGNPKTLTWTQYKQVGDEPKAGLTYRASLAYTDDGRPDRGIAEQWDKGQKVATFLDWSRFDRGLTKPNPESWAQWESWVKNVSLQARLP